MKAVSQALHPKLTLYEKHFASLKHPLAEGLKKLILVSDFASQHLDLLTKLLEKDKGSHPINDYSKTLQTFLAEQNADIMRNLRLFRNMHFLRLLLREYAGLASTEETMNQWSHCADALILHTLNHCQNEIAKRFGLPHDADGNKATLYALAMGKLGGHELNYSSDIDLIFAYSAAGNTQGPEILNNEQFFAKVVQLFIQIMQNTTKDGFVFRVDLRLRPYGESGALVTSLAAMETYYQEQGRDWERYAMVKARVIGHSENDSTLHHFYQLITLFTYRKYVDFSVIESLRSMKALIEREVQLNPGLDDIKRGKGGIREIEFIIQNIQLIRGGRVFQLRQQNSLKAMEVLKKEGLLPRMEALKQAYLFLRHLENCIQSLEDKQTHTLPNNSLQQAQLCFAMDYPSWEALIAKLTQYQRIIRGLFNAILKSNELSEEDTDRILLNQLNSVWQGHVETEMAIHFLTSLGFQNAKRCFELIYNFRHGSRCRRLSQTARMRLECFMPLLLKELSSVKDTEAVLLQVIKLLENIITRSAYLALLTENNQALKELLYWFSTSPFIMELLIEYPFLLEVLLEKQGRWQPPLQKKLEEQLKKQLANCIENEAKEDALRQFKLTQWMLAARAEMYGYVSAYKIGHFLADVAQVIIKQVVLLAYDQLAERFPSIKRMKSRIAIIAYGKLGSREMNYNSDLDLVFLHISAVDEEGLITRLTQKIIHMLTTRSQFGVLYQVDTRLRPSGKAGLLVSALDSFLDYQLKEAWTWEHQALIRTRVMVGGEKVCKALMHLKKQVYTLERDKEKTRSEVQLMHEKMRKHQSVDEAIKLAPGGLIHLEFLVQFLVLTHPETDFSAYTNTLDLLKKLAKEAIITPSQYQQFKEAYRYYHHLLHLRLLDPRVLPNAEDTRALILKIMDDMICL